MSLQCEDKLNRLPIEEKYKDAARKFCSLPDQQDACKMLCELPDDVIVEKIKQVEATVGDWAINGTPPGLAEEVQKRDPKMASILSEGLNAVRPEAEKRIRNMNSFANGGLASLGRYGDNDIAHVAKGEVVVPNSVFSSNPGLREGLGNLMKSEGADPDRFTVGGPKASINPYTGQQEFFLPAFGVIGGIVGAASATTLGVSVATAAALGAGAGTFIETGDVGQSLMMAAGAHTLVTMAAGTSMFGAAEAGAAAGAAGQGLTLDQIAMMSAEEAAALGITKGELAAASEYVLGPTASNIRYNAAAAGASTPVTASLKATQAASSIVPTSKPSVIASQAAGGPSAWDKFIKDPIGTIGSTAEDAFDEYMAETTAIEKMKDIGGLGMLAYGAYEDATRQPANTSPWSGAELAQAQRIREQPIINVQQRQEQMQNFRPISLIGTPGYGGSPQMGNVVPQRQPTIPKPTFYASGGGMVEADYQSGGPVSGPGTSTSDSIPARLSDGEFVMTTDAVRGMGNGSLRDGARKMYDLMDQLENRNV